MYEPAAEIERAMIGYEAVGASIGGREPGTEAAPAHLRARASAAYAGYQATRYDDTGRMLPALISDTEAAGGDDREACSVRALVYDTAAALLHRVGETSLAWTAADRALAAAEQSGRPELVALQAYRLSYVIAGRRHPAEALELAGSAAFTTLRVTPPCPAYRLASPAGAGGLGRQVDGHDSNGRLSGTGTRSRPGAMRRLRGTVLMAARGAAVPRPRQQARGGAVRQGGARAAAAAPQRPVGDGLGRGGRGRLHGEHPA